MRKLSYLLILILALPMLEGCLKKSKEDPLLSMRSRKNRLVGKWDLTRWEIDGKDELTSVFDTAYFENACQSNRSYHEEWTYSGYFEIEKGGEFAFWILSKGKYTDKYSSTIYCKNDEGILDIEDRYPGDWDFTVGKKELVITYDDGYFNFYDIDKLSNKELWLSRKTNQTNVVMEFAKRED